MQWPTFRSAALAFFFALSCTVIPTGVGGFFLRAVCGAPATERRDRGNISTNSEISVHANLKQATTAPS
jgi:hypothetical protein